MSPLAKISYALTCKCRRIALVQSNTIQYSTIQQSTNTFPFSKVHTVPVYSKVQFDTIISESESEFITIDKKRQA